MQIAEDIASRAPLAVRVLKREMQRLTNGPGISPDEFEEIQGLRRDAYRSEDFRGRNKIVFRETQTRICG